MSLIKTDRKSRSRGPHGNTDAGKSRVDPFHNPVELQSSLEKAREHYRLEQKKTLEVRRVNSTGSMPTGSPSGTEGGSEPVSMELLMDSHRQAYRGPSSVDNISPGGPPKDRDRTLGRIVSFPVPGTILEIPSTDKSIDEVLQDINPLGRFQRILLLLIFCGAAPILGFHEFLLVTQTIIPKWSCVIPQSYCSNVVSASSYTYTTFHPNTTELLCTMERYQWEWANILDNSVSQWDIACSKGKVILEFVYHVPGGVLGALIVSKLCDKMGRRISFLFFLISSLTVGTMISSAKYFIAYVIFRFLMGLSLGALYFVNYIWVMEHFTASSRSLANGAFDMARLIFVPLLAFLNSFFVSWNYLHLASTITLLTGVLVYFTVPESPRWFLLKGEVDRAEKILKAIASRNREQYPRRIVLRHKTRRGDDGGAWYSWCCKQYCDVKYVIMMTMWCSTHVAFQCIKSKVVPVIDDVNMSESIYAVLGIPLILLCGVVLCKKIGRRSSYILIVMFCILCSSLTIMRTTLTNSLSTDEIVPVVATYLIYPGLLSVLNLWVIELLPTLHRVCVFSIMVALKHGIMVTIPLLLPLVDSVYEYSSTIISIILLLVSLVLSTLLHETKAANMLEVPVQEVKHTRGMALISNTISIFNLPTGNIASNNEPSTFNNNTLTETQEF